MSEWTILDYIEPTGRNCAADWLAGLSHEAQAVIAQRLLAMEGMKVWSEKWASKLSDWDGLIELRVTYKGVQYRPLGVYQPNKRFVLLGGAIEKGNEMPRRHLDSADRRRKQLQKDPTRVRQHEY
ncbi:type II toxin-antitoxin system RelE/ParE family toxin [Mesorhizobium sp. PAMC28654]|uniref:type II toxin-antitoxin system RelE/ParE family toxin n=1 Tax=Mesorhizobium sp. PAMC28654 TaxID=2880934 RepID=UPI001D0A162F|nr:type II toxin-antitoxin system RelE/ParE family toxin [Mesorhizobium sp. PAMC28654]UDL91699.1 type II toxin-antitoxin system RelE/ParE family toxin [Mesorhizobium sp. PAMC28654]